METPTSKYDFSSNVSDGRTGSRHRSSATNDQLLRFRYCGKDVVVRTSWTSLNPGRRFRGCPGNEGQYCGTFQWVDPPICRRSKEIIPGLLNRISEYESRMKSLNVLVQVKETRRYTLRNYLFILIFVWLVTICIMLYV